MDILEQNEVIFVMVNLKYSLSQLLKEHYYSAVKLSHNRVKVLLY